MVTIGRVRRQGMNSLAESRQSPLDWTVDGCPSLDGVQPRVAADAASRGCDVQRLGRLPDTQCVTVRCPSTPKGLQSSALAWRASAYPGRETPGKLRGHPPESVRLASELTWVSSELIQRIDSLAVPGADGQHVARQQVGT